MRGRSIVLGLLGLGAFVLAAALCVRLFLAPALVKLPLDQTADPVAIGSNVDFFSQGELEQYRDLDATVIQHVQGDPDADGAGDDVAVWNFGSVMTDSDGRQLDASTYAVCIDRHTAEAVDCPSQQVNEDEDATIEGLTLTFPFGTEKKDYPLFNATTGKAFDATFEGVETLEGLEVYRFVQTIPETVIREAQVPGSLVGSDEPVVPAEAVYSNERTMWVEPVSGVIVTAEEHPKAELRGPDGEQGPILLAGDFAGDDQTVSDGVARAEDFRSQITLIQKTLPLGLAGLGVLLLIVGGLLLARQGRADGGAHRDDEREPVETYPVPQVQ
jgi:hypothetical protein